jgi:hypothetical protein
MPTTSKCAMVKDSDEDEEPGHVGETLDADGDSVMEPVGDEGETVSAGSTGDPIELTDAEDVKEDEDSEISELTVTIIMF